MSKSCKQTLKTMDFYKVYKKTVKNGVGETVFRKVINSFCKEFKNELFNSAILNIPGDLGKCYITKKKLNFVFDDNGKIDVRSSKVSIDYVKTKKLWANRPDLAHKQYIYHTNEHTNGYRCRLMWRRPAVPGMCFIVLSPMRDFKRDLAKFIRENFGKIDYYSRLC